MILPFVCQGNELMPFFGAYARPQLDLDFYYFNLQFTWTAIPTCIQLFSLSTLWLLLSFSTGLSLLTLMAHLNQLQL